MMNKKMLIKEISKREKKLNEFQLKIATLLEEKNKVRDELTELEKIQKKLELLEAEQNKKEAQLENDFQKLMKKQEEKIEERPKEINAGRDR